MLDARAVFAPCEVRVRHAVEPFIIPRAGAATLSAHDCRPPATKILSSNACHRAFPMA
jgi:hypothetical protein